MINNVRPYPRKILAVRAENHLEFTVRVEYDSIPNHGQFFQLSIPKIGEAPISVSAFGDGWLEFTIRDVGKVTGKLFGLNVGDELFLRGPYGNGWPMESFKGKHVVVIAGGTGVAPVKSLLNHFMANPYETKSVNLVCGFRNPESVLFEETLNEWNAAFNCVYTLDNGEKHGFASGMVTKHIPNIPFESFEGDYAVIVVGPPIMMHFSALECIKNGVPEDKIWVSFERKMSCAVGKCGHCRIDETYVCLNGPVFNYTVAKNLLD